MIIFSEYNHLKVITCLYACVYKNCHWLEHLHHSMYEYVTLEYFLWNACWKTGVYPSSVCSKSDENAISAGTMSQGYQDATLSTPSFICAASSLLLSSLPRSISQEISLETWIRISYDVPTHDLECACIHMHRTTKGAEWGGG